MTVAVADCPLPAARLKYDSARPSGSGAGLSPNDSAPPVPIAPAARSGNPASSATRPAAAALRHLKRRLTGRTPGSA